MSRIAIVFIFLTLVVHSVSLGGEYRGNKLLEILGEDKSGDDFKKFKSEYILDKSLKNPELGIKLTAGHDSVSIITAITITASGNEINDIKYKQFSGALPFDLSFSDDGASLAKKIDNIKGGEDDIKMKFKKDGITVNIFFKSAAKKRISYIKFTQSVGMVGAYRLDNKHEMPVLTASATPQPIELTKLAKPTAVLKPGKADIVALPSGATFSKSSPLSSRSSGDPFYNAIMNVIESGEEEMFKDIKKDVLPKPNFWSYKYTYATSVSIPGEKYNMLYSFPFQSSQLDFVSVLEEADAANPIIETKYAEVEAKLKEYFKPSEGWSYHYIVNQEDPKGIKDFELKNPKLGSIVLDHSINPYGKHVLYIRFLLQYT